VRGLSVCATADHALDYSCVIVCIVTLRLYVESTLKLEFLLQLPLVLEELVCSSWWFLSSHCFHLLTSHSALQYSSTLLYSLLVSSLWPETSLKLSPVCSPQFSGRGKPSEFAIATAETVRSAITGSKVFDLDELCIAEGKAVWVLYIDMVCLDFDGNLLDACFLSAIAALRSLRIPQTKIEDDGEVIVTEQRPYEYELKLTHLPVSTTFGVIDGVFLADPSAEEEALTDSRVSFVFNDADELCQVLKPGGSPLSDADMKACMKKAKVSCMKLYVLYEKVSSEFMLLNMYSQIYSVIFSYLMVLLHLFQSRTRRVVKMYTQE
jgi:exosome complex RNA-binding protein Rrp42 (RNase PH superfamily)